MQEAVMKRINQQKIIAIMRNVSQRDAPKVAAALLEGGIELIEVALNQSTPESAFKIISRLRGEFGGAVCLGAGTVLTARQVELAAEAGAQFILSPDVCRDVIIETRKQGLVSIPGAITPSEITAAMGAGAHYIKVFPGGLFGADYIRAIRAPLGHVPMLAVGGVHEGNIPALLEAGCLGFGLGGHLVSRKHIEAGDFGKITQMAKALCALVNGEGGSPA